MIPLISGNRMVLPKFAFARAQAWESHFKDLLAGDFLAALGAGAAFWVLLYFFSGRGFDASFSLRNTSRYVLLVGAYPILEELVFRGAIQGWLSRTGWAMRKPWHRITASNVLTSILFSLLHTLRHSHSWAVAIFLPSLLFGYFRDKTGRLSASIVLHIFYNAGYFFLFRFAAQHSSQ